MQLHPVNANVPGDDLWMVRAALTTQRSASAGDVERYTAVDLEPGDTTPGVFPMQYEHGALHPAGAGTDWIADRDRIEAWDDQAAAAAAHATYDAARAFLELQLAPDTGERSETFHPGELTLDLGDDRWTFPMASAPAQAWAILQAARTVRADALTLR
jgi:hypothetical protein